MLNTTYENAGSFEPTAADWEEMGAGMVAFEQECTLRDIALSFDDVVAGKRKLTDQDRSLIEMLTGALKKAHLASAVDSFASKLAEGQDLAKHGPKHQIDARSVAYGEALERSAPVLPKQEVESSFAMETVLLWASLDAEAFLAITDPHELVAAAHRIVGNFNSANCRYGRALYEVNTEVFHTVTLMHGELMDASSSLTDEIALFA